MLSKFLHGIDPVLLRLAGYAKPYKWQLLMSCFWMIIVAGTTAITSKLLGLLTDVGQAPLFLGGLISIRV